jgi:hypothetical protein
VVDHDGFEDVPRFFALDAQYFLIGLTPPWDVLGGAVLGTLCALFFSIPAIRAPLHRRLAAWATPGLRGAR